MENYKRIHLKYRQKCKNISTHPPNDYVYRGENLDIAKRCKELGIIHFDGAEMAVKEDVLTALNAIEANMNVTSDEEMYNRIKELQNAKNTGI